jgi:F-type H+-transporting ATPase subunit gamma
MQTLEGIRQQIQTSERLHGVVRTMKLLSLTSIRQCEEAVDSLADYDRTVQMGLQIALRRRPRESQRSVIEAAPDHRPAGAIVFGSTWGMCGRFNEDLAAFASEKLDGLDGSRVRLWALGDYVAGPLQRAGWPPEEAAPNPESVDGITRRVQDLLVRIDRWRERHAIGRLALYYNEAVSSASYTPTARRLLPLDRAWLAEREAAPWPTRQLPTFRMEWDALFAALVRQYLFVSLYRAFAESLAGEHASRLAAMQRAETNVEERLDMLEQTYHRRRQRAITEEVLDITAGFEALRTDSRREAAETVSKDAGW